MEYKGPKLYRYLEKQEFADGWVRQGCVQIGSLQKYREMESDGSDAVRGDGEEGKKTVHVDEELYSDLRGSENLHPAVREFVKISDGAVVKGLLVQNLTAVRHAENCRILCCSDVFRFRLLARFSCVACVEIFNPPLLAERITQAIGLSFRFVGWAKVRYREARVFSHRHAEWNSWPGDLKPITPYGREREVRAIWQSVTGNQFPKSELLRLGDLSDCSRIHYAHTSA